VKSFTEIFKQLCACQNSDLQFRALYIIRNIVKVNQELAIRIVETELMDILFAIKEIQDDRLVNEKVFYNFLLFLLYSLILESNNRDRYRSNLFAIRSYSTEQRSYYKLTFF
jgi:hypothetical protein